jgi:hypothetical protein
MLGECGREWEGSQGCKLCKRGAARGIAGTAGARVVLGSPWASVRVRPGTGLG